MDVAVRRPGGRTMQEQLSRAGVMGNSNPKPLCLNSDIKIKLRLIFLCWKVNVIVLPVDRYYSLAIDSNSIGPIVMSKTKTEETTENPEPSVEDAAIDGNLVEQQKEYGGPRGKEPTRYGDWEKNGRCIDF